MKPFKKISEEVESDHGTDNEAEIAAGGQRLVLTKKKQVGEKKRKMPRDIEQETENAAPENHAKQQQKKKRNNQDIPTGNIYESF